MTQPTHPEPRDTIVARMVREILGDATRAWIDGGGPTRLATALAKALATTGPTSDTATDTAPCYTVRLDALRTRERIRIAKPSGTLHAWLCALVADERAFNDLFDNPAHASNDTETTALRDIRVRHILRPDGTPMGGGEPHRTWVDETSAQPHISAARATTLSPDEHANARTARVRIGRATRVERAVTLRCESITEVAEIAATARAIAQTTTPHEWTPEGAWWPQIPYAVWIAMDDCRHDAPAETRLFRHYRVRIARLLEETTELIVEGARENHEGMLEDAISAALKHDQWTRTPGHVSEHIAAFHAINPDGRGETEDVPDGLRMLDRI